MPQWFGGELTRPDDLRARHGRRGGLPGGLLQRLDPHTDFAHNGAFYEVKGVDFSLVYDFDAGGVRTVHAKIVGDLV